jgi:hypothetical protein
MIREKFADFIYGLRALRMEWKLDWDENGSQYRRSQCPLYLGKFTKNPLNISHFPNQKRNCTIKINLQLPQSIKTSMNFDLHIYDEKATHLFIGMPWQPYPIDREIPCFKGDARKFQQ